jgi:hypothetical protein
MGSQHKKISTKKNLPTIITENLVNFMRHILQLSVIFIPNIVRPNIVRPNYIWPNIVWTLEISGLIFGNFFLRLWILLRYINVIAGISNELGYYDNFARKVINIFGKIIMTIGLWFLICCILDGEIMWGLMIGYMIFVDINNIIRTIR